ncbi:phosphoribosyltransferase family protein [Campylobacter ureolyticus]|nr:phosphoribosyltransferase family protein [Campylobacter ureolyticus]MDU5325306.1 phosphoribosyltransferase family protein [Campylobacter ureolyticus]
MTLKRGFEIQKNQRILIVEDIVTTGGSIKEVVEVVKSFGGNIIGIAMLVNRSGKELIFDGVKSKALLNLNVSTYKADECELCKKNIPLTKRGRTGK